MIKPKVNLEIPRVLIHLLGLDAATFLMIANSYAKREKFKMPFQLVAEECGMNRHKQDTCRDFLQQVGLLKVEAGECKSEGKTYSFPEGVVRDLNYILTIVEEKDIAKFRNKIKKNIIGKSLDIEKIISILERDFNN